MSSKHTSANKEESNLNKQEEQKMNPQFDEFLQVFQDICLDLDVEQAEKPPLRQQQQQRRSSLDCHTTATGSTEKGIKQHRRHSGYESHEFDQEYESLKATRATNGHYVNQDLIEQLIQVHDVMDLHSTVGQQQLQGGRGDDEDHYYNYDDYCETMTPAMQYECAILSYLEDDDEDSVELAWKHKPQLISPNQVQPLTPALSSAKWETMEDGDEFLEDEHEYTMSLSPSTATATSDFHVRAGARGVNRRPRQRHSYQIVQEYLREPHTTPIDLANKLHLKGSIYELDQPDLPLNPMTYKLSKTTPALTFGMSMKSLPSATGSSNALSSKSLHADLQTSQTLPPPQHSIGVARGA